MSYIGTPPSNAFTSLLKQDFSTSATTGYTLDHAVNNANDIALFINFVRQEPTAGYAASGTTLTLTSATASSDDMYCVYLGQALQTVNPPNVSVGTAQLIDGAVTSAKLGTKNTPAFEAYGAEQTGISSSTWTKISFGTEVFDTNSMYDTSAYRFTPTVAGKYFIYGGLSMYSDTAYQAYVFNTAIYKNGSRYQYTPNNANPSYDESERFCSANATLVMNGSSDYVEIYARCVAGSGTVVFDSRQTIGIFGGYKIIE